MNKVVHSDATDSQIETLEGGLVARPNHEAAADSEVDMFLRMRGRLTDESGQSFADFKAGLRPRYYRVWIQTTLAYAGLLLAGLLLARIPVAELSWWQTFLIVAVLSIFIGYLVAFIALWLHEAAHFNVHHNRDWNDRLGTLFFGVIILHHVRQYRQIHNLHHRNFGNTTDSEQSYFSELNIRFIFDSLTGLRVLRAILARKRTEQARQEPAPNKAAYTNWALPAGALLHGTIVVGSVYFQCYALTVGWLFGVFVAYPFFGAIRQVLEHRRPDADASCDYSKRAHGQYTRVFDGGLFASTFGGAGFNRHLIHHWDPGISCTCFKEVEQFLLRSQLHDFYASRQTNYKATFVLLMSEHARSHASNP